MFVLSSAVTNMLVWVIGLLVFSSVTADYPAPSKSYGAPTKSKGSRTAYEPAVQYAGPIIYTDERPPIIQFPPPPSYSQTGSKGGYGKGKGKTSEIKFVPLPHHELPVLIYQSEHNPPIHVVHNPNYQKPKPTKSSIGYGKAKGGSATGIKGGLSLASKGGFSLGSKNGLSLGNKGGLSLGSLFGKGGKKTYKSKRPSKGYGKQKRPAPTYGPPKKLAPTYGPPKKPSVSYGPPKKTYGPPKKPSKAYGPPKTPTPTYGPPKVYQKKSETIYIKAPQQPSPVVVKSPRPTYASNKGYDKGGKGHGFGLSNIFSKGSSKGASYRPSSKSKAPKYPSKTYEPVKTTKKVPPPHIIYAGHPPIHVYQQPPVYQVSSQKPSYTKAPIYKGSLGFNLFGGKGKGGLSSFTNKGSSFKKPDTTYSSPKKPSVSYGPPKKPLGSYGLFSKGQSASYRPAKRPSKHYESKYSKIPTKNYRPSKPPSKSHVISKRPSKSYGAPKIPSKSYGPPRVPSKSYGPPKKISPTYGPPKQQSTYTPVLLLTPEYENGNGKGKIHNFIDNIVDKFSSSKKLFGGNKGYASNTGHTSNKGYVSNKGKGSKKGYGSNKGYKSNKGLSNSKGYNNEHSHRPTKKTKGGFGNFYSGLSGFANKVKGYGGQKQVSKRPSYIKAPKELHKPPIIIYQGVKPPVHVYESHTSGSYKQPTQSHKHVTHSFRQANTHVVKNTQKSSAYGAPKNEDILYNKRNADKRSVNTEYIPQISERSDQSSQDNIVKKDFIGNILSESQSSKDLEEASSLPKTRVEKSIKEARVQASVSFGDE